MSNQPTRQLRRSTRSSSANTSRSTNKADSKHKSTHYSTSDINDPKVTEENSELLNEFHQIKLDKIKIEKRYNDLRTKLLSVMDKYDTHVIVSRKYNLSLKKKDSERSTLSKNGVPKDVWEKYKKTSLCSTLYLAKLSK